MTRRTPLVGREAELGRLLDALEHPDRGAVIAIEGEPGIGKTRLLEEFAECAEERRLLVLEGQASEGETDVPFALFIDALDDYIASVNPRLLRPADPEGRTELARIFPSLAELAEPGLGAVQEERYRSHRAVRTMLEGLAASRPLLLSLDDLHWADQASLELISHLLRHPPRGRVVLALACRAGQMPAALSPSLAQLERGAGLERIELEPLSRRQAEQLIGEISDTPAPPSLFHTSGGNPFYLEQLARMGNGERETRTGEADPIAGVPPAVAAAIAEELRGLEPGAERLLRGGAIVGDLFDPQLAGAVAELEIEQALAALDLLLGRDLVRQTETPRRFRFRHPIVRQAVYDGAPVGWRLAAHARAAAALARRGAAASVRAPHLERCADPGDVEAAAVLAEAGEAAAARAPAAAAHWFEAALGLLAADAHQQRLALLAARAKALAACGEYEQSLDDLAALLELIPPAESVLRGRVIASQAKLKQLLGRHGEARAELLAALEALDDPRRPEGTALKLELAADCFFESEYEAFEDWIREALEDARASADQGLIAAATGLHSAALYMRGDLDAARRALDQATALIDALPDELLARHLNSFAWTALGAVYMERFEIAVPLLERAIACALATGQGQLPTLMRTTEAVALINLGELGRAASLLEAAIETSILTRNPVFGAWARALASRVALIGGDVPEALRLAELADGEAGDDPISATAACYLAEVWLAGGDPKRARETLLARSGGDELPRIELAFRSCGYEMLALAELELGEAEAARSWASRAAEAAGGLGIEGRSADALRAGAAVALAAGDTADALSKATEAATAAGRAGLPIDTARARILGARALAEQGKSEAARLELERIRDELAAIGAGRLADEAAGHLRRLGVRVTRGERGAQTNGGSVLSARESEIAELVAAGKRNREIAEALFLSVRTVEGHLARIFRKLEVGSRTQLAAALAANRARDPSEPA